VNRMLTLKEASQVLNVSRDTLYRLLKEDETFPGVRVGHHWRVDPNRLQEWLDRQPKAGPAARRWERVAAPVSFYQLRLPGPVVREPRGQRVP